MEYNITKEDDVFIINLLGDLVAGKIYSLKEDVEKILKQEKPKIIFNFADVEFIDSSGIGLIVNALKKLSEKNSKLKLCNLNKTVTNIFKQIKIYSFFEVYDSLDEAIDSFESWGKCIF